MSAINNLVSAVREILQGNNAGFSSDDLRHGAFKALGKDRLWIAAYTNDFEDRDGEILTHDAHRRYIARVKSGFVALPELWEWHIKGTKHGEAIYLDQFDHFVVAIGQFDDTPAGRAAEAFHLKTKEPQALSHGFNYPVWARSDDGKYIEYNTFEISVLPKGEEANQYVQWDMIAGETEMNKQQRARIIQKFGEDVAEEIIANIEKTEQAGKALEQAGVKFKARYGDFVDLTKARRRKEEDEEYDDDEEKEDGDVGEVVEEGEVIVEEEQVDEILNVLLEAQATVAEAIEDVAELVNGAMEEMVESRRRMQEREDELEKMLRDLKARKPRLVDQGTNNTVSEKEADAVKKVITARQGDAPRKSIFDQ